MSYKNVARSLSLCYAWVFLLLGNLIEDFFIFFSTSLWTSCLLLCSRAYAVLFSTENYKKIWQMKWLFWQGNSKRVVLWWINPSKILRRWAECCLLQLSANAISLEIWLNPYLPIHFLFCFKFKPFSLHYSFNLFSRQNSFRFPFAPIWPLNSVGFCIGRYSTQPRKLLNTAWQAQDTPTHAQWRFTHRAWRPLASHGFWCLQWHAYSSWLYCSYVLLRFFFLFLGNCILLVEIVYICWRRQ